MDNSEISIFGLDDILLGKPKIEKTLQHARQNTYNIVLVHEPDIAPQISKYQSTCNFLVIAMADKYKFLLGAIITPSLAKDYIEGFYTMQDLTLYVNRGLGRTRVPFRFMSKPEITIFTPTFVIIRLFSYISFLVRAHPCFVYHMIKVSPIKEVCSCIHIINQFQSVQHLLVQ